MLEIGGRDMAEGKVSVIRRDKLWNADKKQERESKMRDGGKGKRGAKGSNFVPLGKRASAMSEFDHGTVLKRKKQKVEA